jgi:ribonuclease PH
MNLVMTGSEKLVEVQGTAEGNPFSWDEMSGLMNLAKKGILELIVIQRETLGAALAGRIGGGAVAKTRPGVDE